MPYCSIEEAWGDSFMNNLSPETQYNPSFQTNNMKNINVKDFDSQDQKLEEIPKKIKKQIKKIEDQEWEDTDSPEDTDNGCLVNERFNYNQDRQNLERERKRKMNEYEEYTKMINNNRFSKSYSKNKSNSSNHSNDTQYNDVIEGFSSPQFNSEYTNIDLIIIILLGIFLLFSMDIFVRIGKYMKC
jgi:hypothetical protein